MFCKHTKNEVYTEARGFWAQCNVCGGVGPLKDTHKQAKDALKTLKLRRPHQQGGKREGAGRKKTLSPDSKFRAFTLGDDHMAKLDAFVAEHNALYEDTIKGRSASLRTILEAIDPAAIAASLGA